MGCPPAVPLCRLTYISEIAENTCQHGGHDGPIRRYFFVPVSETVQRYTISFNRANILCKILNAQKRAASLAALFFQFFINPTVFIMDVLGQYICIFHRLVYILMPQHPHDILNLDVI